MSHLPHTHLEPTGRLIAPVISRRALLAAGGAAVAGLSFAGSAHAADTVETFRLDPLGDPTCGGSACSACTACRGHAANKLFASLAAAEAGRAHPGCRCVAVTGMPVAQTVFDQLFATMDVADRRTPAIGALLASAPATVSAPGISGVLPAAITVGGLVAIGWAAIKQRAVDPTP